MKVIVRLDPDLAGPKVIMGAEGRGHLCQPVVGGHDSAFPVQSAKAHRIVEQRAFHCEACDLQVLELGHRHGGDSPAAIGLGHNEVLFLKPRERFA